MARTAQARYFKTTVASGSVYQLTTTAGSTANNATIARYNAGGTTSSRRFTPLAASTTDNALPSVDTAPANSGWRDNVAENAADQVRYAAGSWEATIRYRRSGQALELDQDAKVTAIFYRVTTGGTFVAELGRATSATITYTTTVQSLALATASIGPFTFNAGDKVQIEVYVVAEALGIAAAPTVATDLWLTIDESSTSSRVAPLPSYDILYARGIADTAAATDALTRRTVQARSIADTAPASDTLIRRMAFPRAIADTAPASDAVIRTVSFPRAIADSAPASDAVTRSAGTFARSIADSAPAVDTLARLITYGRFIDEEIGTPVAGALVKLVRQADDRVVRSMTTVAGGAYSFDRDILDVAGRDGAGYYVISYVDGSVPQIHGVSDRGLLPELI